MSRGQAASAPLAHGHVRSSGPSSSRRVVTFARTRMSIAGQPHDDSSLMPVATDAQLTHLQRLEAESIHIMREVVAECQRPVMLYSIGKDSSVMLHLALKAFFPARPPFPFLHIDTTWKFRDMIAFRDETASHVLQVDVLPDVELGPVRHGEHAEAFALAHARVVCAPQLGTLLLRIPPTGTSLRSRADHVCCADLSRERITVVLFRAEGFRQLTKQSGRNRTGGRLSHPATSSSIRNISRIVCFRQPDSGR